MSEAVLVALIGLAGSAVGSLLGIAVSQKLTQYRLDQIEKKLDELIHAQATLAARVYRLEQHDEVQDERQKVVNDRLDDLEKKVFG